MKRLVALMMCAVSLGAAAQSTITYPYNPDEDGNGQIAIGDLQGILSTYGNAFSPSEILVDGETLTTVLTQLQNSIDSLSGLTGGGGSVLDMPLGTILPIATESVPEGWMLCDGREISIEEYQGLYDLIGTTYGAGDSAFWAQVFYPATTFNIPDLRGRTIIGANNMGGEQSDVLTIHHASPGQIGGEETHQLTEDEMPSHSHFTDHSGHLVSGYNTGQIKQYNNAGTWFTFVTSINETVGPDSLGNDIPHNNMQPYMALNYMMKVQTAEDVVATLESTIESQQSQINLLSGLIDSVSGLLPFPPSPITLECVDMGFSPLCGAFGLSESVSLNPSDGAYQYSLACQTTPNNDGFFTSPHWRKFKIDGLPPNYSNKIFIRYLYYPTISSGGNSSLQVVSLPLDIDESGNAFVYFYCSPNDPPCIGDGLELTIPLASGFNTYTNYSYDLRTFEIGYTTGRCLIWTGAMIDF